MHASNTDVDPLNSGCLTSIIAVAYALSPISRIPTLQSTIGAPFSNLSSHDWTSKGNHSTVCD